MYLAILGRQPAISIAELERLYGDVAWFSSHAALVEAKSPLDVERLGGSQKVGRVVIDVKRGDWRAVSMKIVQYYTRKWAGSEGKITLGISAYDFSVSPRDIQKTGLILKSKLKDAGVSVRLVPNQEIALSTATSHHNKLGLSDNKVELLVARSRDGRIVVAESTGAQNITALARRDQGRPKRDAFVGMLPPKLAQIMVNLTGVGAVVQPHSGDHALAERSGTVNLPRESHDTPTLLDPFCGTGVLLQEAALLGFNVYGTDLADKMIDFTTQNLAWLKENWHLKFQETLHQGDAMDTRWQKPIDVVAAETYLGQPFSAPPSPAKLREVVGTCDHIIGGFLTNLAQQIDAGTPVVLAVPAWRDGNGGFTHLPLVRNLERFGFSSVKFETITPDQLLYYREDQVVAREILVLQRA